MTALDVRLVLKTKDDALIGMTYRALRHGRVGVIERIERGEVVDSDSYYFRINPLFETAAPQYDWINRVIASPSVAAWPRGQFKASLKCCERFRQSAAARGPVRATGPELIGLQLPHGVACGPIIALPLLSRSLKRVRTTRTVLSVEKERIRSGDFATCGPALLALE